ncbi:hypothetical protein JCM17845_28770 [Iodidimonas gelatinilytica]|uniref:Uncharacterized protein n=1 Tax=Iodidimonas gelatinilytica TaxID=1236966 RepID=A0A5A7N3E8_9PROT|nr:hypothetical protein JCM17845_28770 [Iodidimonas gelatinilytica]
MEDPRERENLPRSGREEAAPEGGGDIFPSPGLEGRAAGLALLRHAGMGIDKSAGRRRLLSCAFRPRKAPV